MNKQNYINDIVLIKNYMAESSKFLLFTTGLSGLYSGILAILGMGILFWIADGEVNNIEQMVSLYKLPIVIILLIVFVLSTLITVFLTRKNARLVANDPWNPIARKMVYNFYSVLLAGGIYVLILFFQQDFKPIVELMLIFYGTALLNGAKYTFDEVRILGIAEIVCGLVCTLFQGYDFWFWTIGFGLINFIYGCIMYARVGK